MSMPITPECFSMHLGPWAILPVILKQAVSSIRAGMWEGIASNVSKPRGTARAVADQQRMVATPVIDPATAGDDYPDIMYLRTETGVALLEMTGGMMKGRSKFGGVSTVDQRKYIRAAAQDPQVGSILLIIDSPGGTVSGTQSLADEVRAADAVKPVLAHFEDMGASAAYWVGSQARRVSANRSAMVGSLGTFGVIEDSSGKAAAEGVVVHVLSTGPHKGAFAEGAPVTKEQLAEYQRIIDQLNEQFIQAVAGGRRMSDEKTRALFDGRVHVAPSAKELGLLDAIEGLDAALAEASRLAQPPQDSQNRSRRTRMAGLTK